MKRALRLGISLGLSGLFLWFAFHNVDLDTMWAQLRQVRWWAVVAFALLTMLIQLCRILRWEVLVRPFVKISTPTLFRVSGLGLMLIMVLPLRLGEFARPYLLKKETGAPFSAGVGSVVVERAMDGLLVTVLFFLTTFLLGASHPVPRPLMAAAVAALLFFAAVTVVIIFALITEARTLALVRRLGTPLAPRLTERAVGMLGAFVVGLRSLPDVRALAVFIGYTLIYWAANGWGMYLVMRGMGWDVPLLAGFTIVCVLVIGIMIPAGPGHLGTFQGALLAGLSIFNIGASEAAAYGMVIYPLTLLVIIAFGVPYLFGHGGEVSEIMRASAAAEEGAAGPS
ncbi:MAG: flippase-like domain-containing protein [Deltaproteobacteria bacterium]|nr:flippase-like domain-containing protein [Deltaproteobacteria bacterium]